MEVTAAGGGGEETPWCERDTSSGHLVGTPRRDTSSGHLVGTPRRNTSSGHCVRTLHQDTASGHCVRTPSQDTSSGHLISGHLVLGTLRPRDTPSSGHPVFGTPHQDTLSEHLVRTPHPRDTSSSGHVVLGTPCLWDTSSGHLIRTPRQDTSSSGHLVLRTPRPLDTSLGHLVRTPCRDTSPSGHLVGMPRRDTLSRHTSSSGPPRDTLGHIISAYLILGHLRTLSSILPPPSIMLVFHYRSFLTVFNKEAVLYLIRYECMFAPAVLPVYVISPVGLRFTRGAEPGSNFHLETKLCLMYSASCRRNFEVRVD